MKYQKICIIGGGITGLITAVSLSKLNCAIDLIIGNPRQYLKSKRSIAVSEDNFNFLDKLNISKSLKKEIWPCSIMKLYTEGKDDNFIKVFELNNEKKQKKILYMFENFKLMKLLMNKIKKTKCISVKKYEKVSSISTKGLLKNIAFNNKNYKYNLVIICTGHNSSLVKNLFNSQIIENSYKEIGITTILNHSSFKNNTVRQIFLDNEILALLPISNTKTSIVWSVKKSFKKKNSTFIKKKIKFYLEKYLKNITFNNKIEYKDLNLLIRNKYYIDRVLLFGDALHVMHPFIGQGFNMVLRDLSSLQKILYEKISLGLDIGGSDILSEFTNKIKPRNFVFSVGSDLLKKSISSKKIRKDAFKILNRSNFAKDVFFNIADKGFRF